MLRSGDRIVVVPPTNPIDVTTRYGVLTLQPSSIAAIAFQSEDTGVHQVFLTDGSRFAGLIVGDHFDFKLAGGAGGQAVTFPASAMSRLQISNKLDEPDENTPSLELMNDDTLVGSLVGQLGADDWKQRERAEAQLISMGPAVISIVKELRATVGPEAQQRIDSVIRQVEKSRSKSGVAAQPTMDE